MRMSPLNRPEALRCGTVQPPDMPSPLSSSGSIAVILMDVRIPASLHDMSGKTEGVVTFNPAGFTQSLGQGSRVAMSHFGQSGW